MRAEQEPKEPHFPAYCLQCGKRFSTFQKVFRYISGYAETSYCSARCRIDAREAKKLAEAKKAAEATKLAEATAEKAERKRAAHLKRIPRQQKEAEEKKELTKQENQERNRRERKEREEREKKEWEERKKPFLDAVAADPQDAGNYIRLGDFLFKEIGLENAPTSDSHWIDLRHGLLPGALDKTCIEEKLETYHKLFLDAKEFYLKAISLGNMPDFYSSARVKLNFSIILAFTEEDPQSRHYAREAEKDLRKHLRTNPDDIIALKNMAVAIGHYEVIDKVRTRRLQTVEARINEARTRLELNYGPPPKLLPPGSPESPYPENWHELSKNIKKRDGYRCTECEAVDVELHVHHVQPLSQGGSNEFENLITLCDYCHKERHSR